MSGKDVSARNDAVAALEQLHTRYRALVANLPDTIVILFDRDLRILVAEGAQLARRGLDADTFRGMQFEDALSADQGAMPSPALPTPRWRASRRSSSSCNDPKEVAWRAFKPMQKRSPRR